MMKLFSSPANLFLVVFVLLVFNCPVDIYGEVSIPSVVGPLKVTADSYPFDSAVKTTIPQDLSNVGYVEEEYLISGKANVYEFDPAGKVIIKTANAPYTTRILVRKPTAARKFSGNVIVEPLNPALGFDFDLQWMFCRDYFIEHGDTWVGITVRPVGASALKKFNPERYAPLSWINPLPPDKTCPKSTLKNPDTAPETENGLAWDIISQVGALVRSDQKQNPLKGLKVEYVYATGYSLTGAYLMTYINFIRPLPTAMLKKGRPVFDGYLIGDGEGVVEINQCSQAFPPGVSPIIIRPRKEPVISVVMEGSLMWSLSARRPDSDAADDRYRRYEVAGGSHGNKLVLEFGPSPGEMEKLGIAAPAPKCIGADKYGITDFHFEYLMNAAFANLDAWARSNIPPPGAQVIETGPGKNDPNPEVKLDKNGNAIGGLRSPDLDVPVAVFHTKSKPADEKSSGFCASQGYKVPFEKEKIIALYPTRENYLSKVNSVVDSMVKARFLTETDGRKIKKEAEKLSVW
jgi:hypothetical protein